MSPTSHMPAPPDGAPEPPTDAQREAVQDLLTRVIDARAGHEAVLNRAEPEIEPLIRKFREEHHQQAERIAAILVALGGEPDTSGSFMSTVNKTVVSLRALFDDLDDDALEQIADGESHVLDAFDDAIRALDGSHHRTELSVMKDALAALVVEARKLAD